MFSCAAIVLGSSWASAQVTGDPQRGAQVYRACAACHSLRPDVHLTGPSLAGVWGRQAGTIRSFTRYSDALQASGIFWETEVLDAWLDDPAELVPGTSMSFPGIGDDAQRADLVAFLRDAMAPGGAAAVVERGLIPAAMADGQLPPSMRSASPSARVAAVRYCGDAYHVETADGAETRVWEMNLRFKTDGSERGPAPGQPVLIPSGMMGDRASLVFSSPREIASFVQSQC
jgi:cytochrome c